MRRCEDVAGRAVVLLQLDDLRAGEVLLEVEDVGDVRAAPLVDALVIVADDADVAVLFGQRPDELVLDMVGVLVLVDHDVAESPLILIEHGLVALKEADRVEQQVVEVHRVVLLQFVFIALVDAEDHIFPVAGAECRPVGPRGDLLFLAIADLAEERTDRELLLVDLLFFDDRFDDRLAVHGVVDRKRITVT